MARSLWWLNAETSIHVGAGGTASLVDQPVAREATTGYPFIPGSGLKGALRDAWRFYLASQKEGPSLIKADEDRDVVRFFGRAEEAGDILVSDARLLLLPMRSLNHAFVWVTCPYVLNRYARDREFCGLPELAIFDNGCLRHLQDTRCRIDDSCEKVWIEDHQLEREGDPMSLNALTPSSRHDGSQDNERYDAPPIVVVSDRLFGHFARSRIPVRMRNQLNPDTKTVKTGHLWSEEALPPETVLYTILSDRLPHAPSVASSSPLADFEARLGKIEHVQVGANETVGQGWVHMVKEEEVKGTTGEEKKQGEETLQP